MSFPNSANLSTRGAFLAILTLFLIACGTEATPTPAATPIIPTISISPTPIPKATSRPAPTPTLVPPTLVPKTVNPDDEVRLEFFRKGGIWSFRVNPEAEKEWTILVLASKSALAETGSVILGGATHSKETTVEESIKVLELYGAEQATFLNFLRIFADGVDRGEFEALLMKTAPIPTGKELPIRAAVSLTKEGFLEVVADFAQ